MKNNKIDFDEYVYHSNRIEGETTSRKQPLFVDHIDVAMNVAEDPLPYSYLPLTIHKELMHSQPEKFPGEYRQIGVRVGGEAKMHPMDVRPAMSELLLEVSVASVKDLKVSTEQIWDWHYEFERIHPFIDGNGRVGRLLMNAHRLRWGHTWFTLKYKDRFNYYDDIVEYERMKLDQEVIDSQLAFDKLKEDGVIV